MVTPIGQHRVTKSGFVVGKSGFVTGKSGFVMLGVNSPVFAGFVGEVGVVMDSLGL